MPNYFMPTSTKLCKRPEKVVIPRAESAQVWIDFDGTITQKDVLDALIDRFAVDESWKEIEQEWNRGEIGSYECLRRQFSLLRISQGELEQFLQTIPVDPGWPMLKGLLENNEVPFGILSDGVETFIQSILRLEGEEIAVRSNAIRHDGNKIALLCPHFVVTCMSRAAHCKCASANALRVEDRWTIYIGDGRSDLCAARKADVVFAKSVLARELSREGVRYFGFQNLSDVATTLARAWTSSRSSQKGRIAK